ncbi:hypothetical protein [Microbispora hainanensis]|uniref:hypothetical protein n=1 Tax=Microbispora hainanensis TaxID=568844 RepID=UPI00324FC958
MDHSDLVGVWDSVPYDYGALETCWLAFLQDGRGWAAWANLADGIEVSRFRWCCPAANVLELRYEWHASGDWRQTGSSLAFTTITGEQWDSEVVRTGFAIEPDEAVMAQTPFTALHLEPDSLLCQDYACVRREVSIDDDPAQSISPWPSSEL